MKQVKRIFALALAVMMIMSLAVTAFAAEGDPETYDVVINNASGHTYQIYQIFTGDLSSKTVGGEEVDVLANVKYGADYLPGGVTVDTPVPDSVFEGFDPNTIVPTGAGTLMTTTGDTATATGLVAGYYMIKDISTNLPEGNTVSAVIFQVVEDTTVTSKHTGTTIVKKVQDINDSTGEQPTDENGSKWIDSADYDIGDTVPFKSTAKFEGMANYDTYKVIFTDIMAPGLTYKNDMKVYVNGTERTGSFTISSSGYTNADDAAYTGGTQITVTCENIKAIEGVTNDAEIVLEYTATLNSNAKLGAPGNPNKIRVKTIPDGEGGEETPWDVNIVFTYKLNTNKYADEVKEGNELNGAGFTLYKWYINAELEAGGEWKQIGNEIVGEALSTFEWKGIDDGKYKLEETTTPEGYNTIDPIEFEVTADHDIVSSDPKLTDLTGEDETGEVEFTANENAGTLSTDVVNKAGVVLPETGGIGTTIFYSVGAIMVLVAVVLLVTKKRMASAE